MKQQTSNTNKKEVIIMSAKEAEESRKELLTAIDEGLAVYRHFVNVQKPFVQQYKSGKRHKMHIALDKIKAILSDTPNHVLVEHRMSKD
tara:strand:+ start:222 stop:488 length:267 start_codon:yes stop_codon:yes gene_type:complete